jgi:uncharacterized phage protein gp47/JayE
MSTIYPDDTDMSFTGIVQRLLDFSERPGDPVGGVARTMLEAVARELAIFYATLDRAHQAGFIDTATGPALDRVVAILGIRRARAGRLTGKVEFGRAVAAEHDIIIPAGRRVTGVLAKRRLPLFETVEEVMIARGQLRVLAEVQQVIDPSAPDAPPLLNPGVLTIMPRPVLGVESVRNVDPLRLRQADETDAQLRARARTVLRESQRGSADGIAAALREQGVAAVEVRDTDDDLPPGVLRVIIHDPDYASDPELRARVADAIRTSKPAGIRVVLDSQRVVPLTIQAELELLDPRVDQRGRARIAAELTAAIVQAAAALPSGTTVRSQKLTAPLLAHPEVAGLYTAAITARDLDPHGRPALPGGDFFLDALETPALAADDVKLTWYRRPVLGVELVARVAGTTDATLAAVREVVKQYNAFLRAGGTAGRLFEDLRGRLTARKIELLSLTALRDGVSVAERTADPVKTLALAPGELLQLEDLEVVA